MGLIPRMSAQSHPASFMHSRCHVGHFHAVPAQFQGETKLALGPCGSAWRRAAALDSAVAGGWRSEALWQAGRSGGAGQGSISLVLRSLPLPPSPLPRRLWDWTVGASAEKDAPRRAGWSCSAVERQLMKFTGTAELLGVRRGPRALRPRGSGRRQAR